MYILVFIIFLLCYCTYKWILRPHKLKAHYARQFEQKGYRVVELPLEPYSAPFIKAIHRN
jgi:hypothetical protein